jgi:hypothetical protein
VPKIPEDVQEWLRSVSRREPLEMASNDIRALWEFLNHASVLEAVRRVLMELDGQKSQLLHLNAMDPADQAEILRTQGKVMGVVATFETLWEMCNEG